MLRRKAGISGPRWREERHRVTASSTGTWAARDQLHNLAVEEELKHKQTVIKTEKQKIRLLDTVCILIRFSSVLLSPVSRAALGSVHYLITI